MTTISPMTNLKTVRTIKQSSATRQKSVKTNDERDGMVYFVGAGPGDPELITLKAQKLIARADVIIYAGSLVNPAILAYARPEAERYDSAQMNLEEQAAVMRDAARRGQTVVRLHTGDPSIYGAILEQIRELEKPGIPYAVVPGVSSAFAAAAALGIEFTVPGDTQTVIFSRLGGRTAVPEAEALSSLAAHHASMVIFLSAGMVSRVVDELYAAGYTPDTPVAVVYRASWPDELVLKGTLADIAEQVEKAEVTHHALIVVSPALRRREDSSRSHLYGAALTAPQRQSTTAIIALTRGGAQTGRRLHALLPESVLYIPERFARDSAAAHESQLEPHTLPYTVSVRQVLQSAFQEHSALVCIMSAGIVVRELAPLLRGKHADPAVVVLDEQGRYAISLLGGHQGGANALARRVADLLGGEPVLTTSSDVQGLPALDLLGQAEGWRLERADQMTEVMAALVNGELVGVFQDAGQEDWWPKPAPANLVRFSSLDELVEAAPAAALLITCRLPPTAILQAVPRSAVYHPPCLAVGVGCNRGTSASEIEGAVIQTLNDAGLSEWSVCRLATIEDKWDEVGLLTLAHKRGWAMRAFSREDMAATPNVPNPSATAMELFGVPGVAEPAAMLAARSSSLLVEKRKFANVTVAVALLQGRPDSRSA